MARTSLIVITPIEPLNMDRYVLPLDDPRWQLYQGGYRTAYDASVPLFRLMNGGTTPGLWKEFWDELYHQGSVDSASYAAVPWLAAFVGQTSKLDDNPLGLIAAIELARPSNPPIPTELAEAYRAAIETLPEVLGSHPDRSWDESVVRAASACIALARGSRWLARAYFELDRETAGRWFSEEFGWDFEGIDSAP